MYKFIAPTDNIASPKTYPSEALVLPNGKTLEDELSGHYRTISVSGRSMIGREFQTTKIDGFDGVLSGASSVTERIITVQFHIKAPNAPSMVFIFNAFMHILHSNYSQPNKVQFKDDTNSYYIGQLLDVKEPESGSLSSICEFTISCADPFKYMDVMGSVTDNTVKPSVSISKDVFYNGELKSLSFTSGGGSNYVIENLATGDKIMVKTLIPSGVDVTLDAANGRFMVAGVDKTAEYVTWTSDLETIGNNPNSGYSLSGGTFTNLEAIFRGVLL